MSSTVQGSKLGCYKVACPQFPTIPQFQGTAKFAIEIDFEERKKRYVTSGKIEAENIEKDENYVPIKKR